MFFMLNRDILVELSATKWQTVEEIAAHLQARYIAEDRVGTWNMLRQFVSAPFGVEVDTGDVPTLVQVRVSLAWLESGGDATMRQDQQAGSTRSPQYQRTPAGDAWVTRRYPHLKTT